MTSLESVHSEFIFVLDIVSDRVHVTRKVGAEIVRVENTMKPVV